MTDAYPDVIKDLSENIQPEVENFILDSEIVAFEAKTVNCKNNLNFHLIY